MFRDRAEAGRRLGLELRHLVAPGAVVVGLPRGGVLVAAEVARSLGAPLDVIVVRKIGVPLHPELAMGAIGEDGVRVVDDEIVRRARVTPEQFVAVETAERAELERRVRRFRAGRSRVGVAGREVVIVDDGIATGSTARAACRVARAEGARRIVLAVPVAPRGWAAWFGDVADEAVSLATPMPFRDIGRFYDDFTQTTDDEVLACLDAEGPAVGAGPRPGPERPLLD